MRPRTARAGPRTGTAILPTRAGGRLRLGVVADTHSRPHPALLDLLRARAPDAILHAGDIGDLAVLDALASVAPVHAVRGNIDVRARELPDALTLDIERDGAKAVRILLMHIAVGGPRLLPEARRAAEAAGADLVVCGHSHVPFIGEDRGLGVFNPGSAGPRRFALPIVFGILELGPHGVGLEHVDCETAGRWVPP